MTKHRTREIDGLEIFYREAGDPENPALGTARSARMPMPSAKAAASLG